MTPLTAHDPQARSLDVVTDNVQRLRQLFPEAFTEGKVDIDVLRQLLGEAVDERDEKYGLNWHGKRRARQLALTPSSGTLRPAHGDSVDWNATQNLLIEGDNLEVLKLLQKSYAGQVKLIYIDPPYNTGKDFVYPDSFQQSIKQYQELIEQNGGGGGGNRKFSSNSESSGRFHTDWLNMMYPRLKLAKNLLQDDGIICVSIDDSERDNLRLLMDDTFGEENFVESIIWKKRYGGGAKEKHLISIHEYVLVYAKDIESIGELFVPQSQQAIDRYYLLKDGNFEKRGPYRTHPLEATKSMGNRPNLIFPVPAPDGSQILPKRQWLWSRERMLESLQNGELEFIKDKSGGWSLHSKQYLKDENGETRQAKAFSIIDNVYSQHGTNELIDLFKDAQVFPFPKPTGLIRPILDFGASDSNSIILDFFAGSGSTAHAVMIQNALDGGNRHYILVQLPEYLESGVQKSAAEFCDALGKPHTIAELTKERLRRAAKKVQAEYPMFKGDLGFRVYKLDSTNLLPWDPDPQDVAGSLFASEEHLKAGRTEHDILTELLLKLGLPLTVPIEERTVDGHALYAVGAGTLLACLAPRLEGEAVESVAQALVAWRQELAPIGDSQVVLRDSAFRSDVTKANFTAILEQAGFDRRHIRSL